MGCGERSPDIVGKSAASLAGHKVRFPNNLGKSVALEKYGDAQRAYLFTNPT